MSQNKEEKALEKIRETTYMERDLHAGAEKSSVFDEEAGIRPRKRIRVKRPKEALLIARKDETEWQREVDKVIPRKFMMRNMRVVFLVFFLLFAWVSLYLVKIVVWDGDKIAANAYNRRLGMVADGNIRRGRILDTNGGIIVDNGEFRNGRYPREYPYANAFAHAVGALEVKAGIESKYNLELQKLDFEVLQRGKALIGLGDLDGNAVKTTLDIPLQQYAHSQLNGKKGAIVAIEPSTGKVLAMVSFSDYNPGEALLNWETLKDDEENSPLLNRATQGLYPPGSTFKIITAATAIDDGKLDFTYDCKGHAVFGNEKVQCFDGKVHGSVGMTKAMAVSCNTYFAALGQELGQEKLLSTAEKFRFNNSLNFMLEYSYSSFSRASDWSTGELLQTSFGQGKTLATPMEMSLVAATVANGGVMMKPYIVDSVLGYNGRILDKNLPEMLTTPVSSDTATLLHGMMVSVVETGTGSLAKKSGITAAGKTGTAQNETGRDHSWFIGYAPTDSPKIAVAVLLEETGGGTKATEIAGGLFQQYLVR